MSKCKTCEYNFATFSDDYNGEDVRCKYEICLFEIKEKQSKTHKCCGCKWGTFTGLKYFCMLPRCMPNLGNYNGVERSGKKKSNP